MKRFANLPHQQWFTQDIVDQFNQDESRWRELLLRRLKRALNRSVADDLRLILEQLHPIEQEDSCH